jgi:hypothetical protein
MSKPIVVISKSDGSYCPSPKPPRAWHIDAAQEPSTASVLDKSCNEPAQANGRLAKRGEINQQLIAFSVAGIIERSLVRFSRIVVGKTGGVKFGRPARFAVIKPHACNDFAHARFAA